jgi:1,3-beta-glucan synthase
MCRGNSRSHNNSWIGYCRLSRTMITGYKRKRLGHPSEKLSGDVPRAGWRAVLFSEVVFPIITTVLFVVAYMFVKSFPDRNGRQPPSPLIRIAVISLGPIVWNAAILLTQFIISLFLGPMLDPMFPKFGSAMAFITHILGVIGMIGFFEFLVSHLVICHYHVLMYIWTVVPRALGCFTCCSGSDCCDCNSALYTQNSHLGLPLPGVQA